MYFGKFLEGRANSRKKESGEELYNVPFSSSVLTLVGLTVFENNFYIYRGEVTARCSRMSLEHTTVPEPVVGDLSSSGIRAKQ